jgi:hypothetical protein
MKKMLAYSVLILPLCSYAAEAVPLPEDEWQPLTLRQAESVCVFEKAERPYMDHKYHDVSKKRREECIEKTRKYGLVGKDFIGLSGSYREKQAVRERQLALENRTAISHNQPADDEELMRKTSNRGTTTRGGTSNNNTRLTDLERRLEQLEHEYASLRREVEALKRRQ